MNEKIQELIEQAKEVSHWLDGGYTPVYRVNPEKLAELLINECARVARATPAPNFHAHVKQQLGHTWDMACLEAGHEIVKHFGVK